VGRAAFKAKLLIPIAQGVSFLALWNATPSSRPSLDQYQSAVPLRVGSSPGAKPPAERARINLHRTSSASGRSNCQRHRRGGVLPHHGRTIPAVSVAEFCTVNYTLTCRSPNSPLCILARAIVLLLLPAIHGRRSTGWLALLQLPFFEELVGERAIVVGEQYAPAAVELGELFVLRHAVLRYHASD
jgi:hypothetical protein